MEKVEGLQNYGSKITLKGVEIKGPLGKKEVKISGDEVEKNITESFIQGAAKGIGVSLLGRVYPVLTGTYKVIEGYHKTKEEAKNLGLTDWESTKAGIKGATIAGIKGSFHALIDTLAINSLTIIGGSIGGIIGSIIGAILSSGNIESHIIFDTIFTILSAAMGGAVGAQIGGILGAFFGGGLYNIFKNKVRLEKN
ncbi:MAG: hypothetical protein ACK4GJ_05770 [bacterium]